MRDNFSLSIKRTVAERVNYFCSNPDCMAQTVGPRSDQSKSINVGVAAHIHAASENGPRFNYNMTSEERKSYSNAIWLCQTCAKLIDSDPKIFSVELLYEWKNQAESKASSNIGKTKNSNDISNFEIHVRWHHRTKIKFSLISHGTNHWIVNRLYLKYISEYEYDLERCFPEAPFFQINYSITLSRKYSEYDIIPLTPDQEVHGFQYKGSDSDHFRIEIFGTNVSIVQIYSEIYDVNKKEQQIIKSEKIKIVRDSSFKPQWNKPIPVEQKRLLDDLRPLSYKTISHLNFDVFIKKFDRDQLNTIRKDLLFFNRHLKVELNKSKYNSSSGYDRLETIYQVIKLYLYKAGGWLPNFGNKLLNGKYSDTHYALYYRIKRVLSEIDSLL